jgi:hypothetical protein
MRSRCSKLKPLDLDSEMTRCCANLILRQYARPVAVTRFQVQVLSFSPVASEPESPTWCALKEVVNNGILCKMTVGTPLRIAKLNATWIARERIPEERLQVTAVLSNLMLDSSQPGRKPTIVVDHFRSHPARSSPHLSPSRGITQTCSPHSRSLQGASKSEVCYGAVFIATVWLPESIRPP